MLKFYNYDIVFIEIPDEISLAINITGCPNRCKGCHSPHLQENIGELLTKEILEELILLYGNAITCVCFMGGDSEPQEIVKLARIVHKIDRNIKTAWYSGCDKLPQDLPVEEFNYIKIGRYIESLGGLQSKTTNQRLYKVEKLLLSEVVI